MSMSQSFPHPQVAAPAPDPRLTAQLVNEVTSAQEMETRLQRLLDRLLGPQPRAVEHGQDLRAMNAAVTTLERQLERLSDAHATSFKLMGEIEALI